jgi:hypothetical protein
MSKLRPSGDDALVDKATKRHPPARWAARALPVLLCLGLVTLPGPGTGQAQEAQPCETYEVPDMPCPLSDGAVVGGYIRVLGGRNYFWFGVNTPDTHVSIRLTDLAADYDLYLFSGQTADPNLPIVRSVTPDTEPEAIDAVLHDVGTYVIEVVDDPSILNAPDVPYTLSFALQPAPPAPTPEPPPPLAAPTPTPAPAVSLVAVPAVVGQSPSSAARLIAEAGLVVQVASADAFSPAGTGTVASQDPPPAARLAPGSTVKLGIASGRVVVPNVRGQPEQAAFALLHAAGFDIQTRRRADTVVPSGLATGTNPGEGTILPAASTVELLVSQGH